MIAANLPVQRPPNAKVLIVDGQGNIEHQARSEFANLLRPGDMVVANDAATLPASLSGQHRRTGRRIEIRLAGRDTLDEIGQFSAVVFGEGDFRTPTEDRSKPPALKRGDELELGPLRGTVVRLLNHPRFILLQFEGSPREIWEGLARHGRPIQYAHVHTPLAVWDTWTPIAGRPVAFEPPSAGFVLDWSTLASMSARKIRFGTITHAAGLSSTGDPELDALLPFPEPYRIPRSTALMIKHAQASRGRIVAIGTTVVRALEHTATMFDGVVPPGERLATQRLDASSRLRVVDAILSGTHERGTSHYELLRAFVDDETIGCIDQELNARDYRTHEFGDSVFLERAAIKTRPRPSRPSPLHRCVNSCTTSTSAKELAYADCSRMTGKPEVISLCPISRDFGKFGRVRPSCDGMQAWSRLGRDAMPVRIELRIPEFSSNSSRTRHKGCPANSWSYSPSQSYGRFGRFRFSLLGLLFLVGTWLFRLGLSARISVRW